MTTILDKKKTGNLFFCENFWLLWLSMLVSTAGTFMLLLALSLNVFLQMQSSLLSATVFAIQWLFPIFAAKRIGIISKSREPKFNLVLAELLGFTTSLAIGLLYGHFSIFFIFLLLAIRGIFEAASKSFRTVAIKCYLRHENLSSGVAYVSSAQYLGGALGAIIGTSLISNYSILTVSIVDGASFIFSALLFLILKKKNEFSKKNSTSNQVWKESLKYLSKNKLVKRNYLYLLLSAGLIQGWHNVARTTLPLKTLHLGHIGLIYIQVISSISIFLGAIITGWYLQRKYQSKYINNIFILCFTLLFMILSCVTYHPVISLIMYASFIFLFEVLYTLSQKEMIVSCSTEMLPYISSTSSTLQMTSMMVAVILGGTITDSLGLTLCAFIFIVVSMVLSYFIEK